MFFFNPLFLVVCCVPGDVHHNSSCFHEMASLALLCVVHKQ